MNPAAAPLDMATQARLTVDLDALAANYALLRELADGAEVAPVVKADAYGLGVAPVAQRLWREGARSFFVARPAEGEALRAILTPKRPARIYVLDGCPPDTGGALRAAELTPVLNSLPQIDEWSAVARALGRRLTAALHIDTGLNRLGLRPEEARALAEASDRLRHLDLDLIVSHLACGDDPASPMNARQARAFATAADLFRDARRSLANSSGVFLGGGYLQQLVRPGISLYGGGPFGRSEPRLRPVAVLDAPVLQVRHVPPDETVGYGASFHTETARRIAIVAAGYADGVLRAGSPRGYAWLGGARCAYVGRISMDLIALDVTGCEASPGMRAELFGPNVLLDEAAANAGTIAYELLTRVSPRVTRRYLGAQG